MGFFLLLREDVTKKGEKTEVTTAGYRYFGQQRTHSAQKFFLKVYVSVITHTPINEELLSISSPELVFCISDIKHAL